MLILNFHKNTELANYVNNKLKLLQIENKNFSDLKINLIIKVKNTFLEKQKRKKIIKKIMKKLIRSQEKN